MDFNPLHLINELNNAIGHDTASVLEFLHITDPAVNPAGVREVAAKWRSLATAVEDADRAAQQALHGIVWKGKAADSFAHRAKAVHQEAGKISGTLHKGATAIDKFATEGDDLISQIGNICAQIEEFEVAGLALDVLTSGFASCAATIAAGERATQIVALISRLEESGSALGTVIRTIAEAIRALDRVLEALKDIKGVATVAKWAGEGMKFAALGDLLQDPSVFTHPGKLMDSLAEGALMGIGFGAAGKGLGKALDALSPAALGALSKTLCKLDDLIPEGSKLRPGEGEDSIRSSIANALKKFKQDPIDVVTGEMMIAQTDATLPGILPLVLERTHLSSYRTGGWFGPSWASTLDQRLQLDADGVVLATADGLRLCYPRPEPGVPAFPERGPRWPLLWDGRPGSRMGVTNTGTGHTLVFAHPTNAGRDGVLDLPLQAIEDRNGNWIRIHHSIAGVPVEIEHHGGYRVAIDRHPDQPRITAYRLLDTDGPGTSTPLMRFAYDDLGHLTDVINSSDLPLRYTYDHAGRVTSWTDRNHTSYHYTYDSEGRCVRGEGTDGYQSGTFAYDTAGRTTRATDSLGHVTTVEYNDALRPIRETDPLGNTTITEWDAANERVVAVTDPLGRTTRYEYDEAGKRTAVTRPDGLRLTVGYGDLGLPVHMTAPDGATSQRSYDSCGNLLTVTDPLGATTSWTYDDGGRALTVTDALGGTRQVVCDAAGLPVAFTDELGRTSTATRNAFGQVVEFTDALGRVIRQGWTIEGNALWRESSDGVRQSWTWDAEGNALSHTDRAGSTTGFTVGTFGQASHRVDPDGTAYAYEHDTELRLTGVTNPQGLTWTYSYDPAGRLTSETDFNGRTLTYNHDATGALTSRTNGAGEPLQYVRDVLGLVTEQRSSDDEVTTFRYDAGGRMVQALNEDGQVVITRDAVGRPVTESVDGRTTHREYDALGRVVSRTTPSGLSSRWTWNDTGGPASLTNGVDTLSFTYDEAGRETERRVDDAVLVTQEWDTLDRLVGQRVQGAGDFLEQRFYTYRVDGHLTGIRELDDGRQDFTLDTVGRVTAVDARGWTESYAYDAAGNITHASGTGLPDDTRRDYTGTLLIRSGRTHHEHDAQGRLTRKTRSLLSGQRQSWTYSWNAEERLTRATTPDGQIWQYAYDPLGRRTAKWRVTDQGERDRVDFSWDGDRIAEQITADGTVTTWDYHPGTHRPVTQTVRTPDTSDAPAPARGGFYAVVTDVVGTPTELLATDGTLVWRRRATLWGAGLPAGTTVDIGQVDCPLRFPGQYADRETGHHYNYFRYYDPETGRYLSPDPLGLAPADNHHAYVAHPLVMSDPLGLIACESGKPAPSDIGSMALGLRREGNLEEFADSHGHMHFLKQSMEDALSNVRHVAREQPNTRLHIVLDGFRHGDDGLRNPTFQQLFEDFYKRGYASNKWITTQREMNIVGDSVRLGDREWDSITFWHGGKDVTGELQLPNFATLRKEMGIG